MGEGRDVSASRGRSSLSGVPAYPRGVIPRSKSVKRCIIHKVRCFMSEPQFKRGRLLSKNEISGGVTPLTSRKSRRMCRISSPAPAASQQLSPQSEEARAAAEGGGGEQRMSSLVVSRGGELANCVVLAWLQRVIRAQRRV